MQYVDNFTGNVALSGLALRLRSLRKGRDMTIPDAAEKARVGAISYLKWENDREKPTAAQLKRLADLYGVTVEYLETGNLSTRNQNLHAESEILRTSCQIKNA